MISREEV